MTRIQIRRDTSSNWATYNPVLADGEFALETDTRKLKIGNGEQPYNDLAYQEGETYTLPPATVDTLGGIKVGENLSITKDGTLNATAGSAPANMVTTNTPQDITAVKNFKRALVFYNGNKPQIAINDRQASISLSYEGAISDDSSHILRDTDTAWRVGRYNKQGIISSSTPLQRMGDGPYFNRYPILDSSNLGSYVDGTTITYTDGKLKASGGSAPSNMVTTDTAQTITGQKIFKNSFVTSDRTATTGNRVLINNNKIYLINNSGVRASIDTEGIKLRGGLNSSGLSLSSSSQLVTFGQNNTQMRIYASQLERYSNGSDNGAIILDAKNFSSVAPTGNLKYWTGTETAYTEIATKNADTLYRTTDTNKVYLGTIQIGGGS